MVSTHLISARVSSAAKARFRGLAERQQVIESGLLKWLVESAVRSAGGIEADALKPPGRRLRGSRTCVRLHPDDKLLLRERAASRQMAVATYISVLVHAHLRNLSPLPKAELMALKQSVAEIGAIGPQPQPADATGAPRHGRTPHEGICSTQADCLPSLMQCAARFTRFHNHGRVGEQSH